MLQIEIIEKAKELWPRSTPAELSLLTKIFSHLDGKKAIAILEAARIDSKYATIPFKAIKDRARVMGGGTGRIGSYIECWAVHYQSGYTYNCMVLATNDEGAKCMMEKYLTNRCRVEPSWYTLFVGENSQQNALLYRVNLN
jgi:hypothetical protein